MKKEIKIAVLAEFVATYLLLFIGTGAVIVHDLVYPMGDFGISLCFGVTVYFCVLANTVYSLNC